MKRFHLHVWLLGVSLACLAATPIDKNISLPQPDEIATIETDSDLWHTPKSLLDLLPKLVPSEMTYSTKMLFQKGSIVLKNGTVLHWLAGNKTSILIYREKGERLFVLPKESKTKTKDSQPGAAANSHP